MSDEPAAPGPGHNEPPEPILAPVVREASLGLTVEEWHEWLDEVFAGATRDRDSFLAMFGRFEAGYPLRRGPTADADPVGLEKWNDEIAGRAADLRRRLATVVQQADRLHTAEKAPVLTAARAIDGYKNRFVEKVEVAIQVISARQTIYLQHKERIARRAKEEEAAAAARASKEAALEAARTFNPDALEQAAQLATRAAETQREATASPADLTRVKGQYGAVASLRRRWVFVPDESDIVTLARAVAEGKAPARYLAFADKVIGFAVRSENVREIPGCVIREEKKA